MPSFYVFETCSNLKKAETIEDRGFAKLLFSKELASLFGRERVGPKYVSRRFEHDPGATDRSSGYHIALLRLLVPATFFVPSSAREFATWS
jgi:hypothetical protein